MYYILFTNRPKFSSFAYKQMNKFKKSKKVVLTNNKKIRNSNYLDAEVIFLDVNNNTEMFNLWRKSNLNLDEDIFISDDDVWYDEWVESYVENALTSELYDRVILNNCGIYSVSTKEYSIRQWGENSIGTGIGYSKYLWKWHKWKNHPDGMVYYNEHLPKHNIRYSPRVGIVHLVHSSNMILREKDTKSKWILKDVEKIPDGFLDDIKLLQKEFV